MNKLHHKSNLPHTVFGDIAMIFSSRDSATDHALAAASRKMALPVRAKLFGLVLIASLFSACSDDSVTSNPVDPGAGSLTITDATQQFRDEVQLFVDNVYNPVLVPQCGLCHNRAYAGGASAFPFADQSAVVSYNNAITAVNGGGTAFFDLQNPANSWTVTTLTNGHNGKDGYATDLQNAIQAWADALNNAGGNSGGGNPGNVANLELIDLLSVPSTQLEPAPIKQLPDKITQPGEYATALSNYSSVHNLVTTYCSRCHVDTSATPQRPYFAVSDAEQSMLTMIENQKIDLQYPQKSRIYLRLVTDHHNCWNVCNDPNSTTDDGDLMLQAITAFASSITDPQALPANWKNSKTQKLEDGIPVSTGTPYETYMVSKYIFDDQSKQAALDPNVIVKTASDSAPGGAGVTLAMGKNASWLGGWGVEFSGTGSESNLTALDSAGEPQRQKLVDSFRQYDEYSVEAWVVPANVSQGTVTNPAVIFSLSFGDNQDSILLGQAEYRYVFKQYVGDPINVPRSVDTGADDVVQATLQHVVVTYHHSAGRKIYVNGQLVLDDPTAPGVIPYDWGQIDFATKPQYVTVGAKSSGASRFQGRIRMLRLFNRAITQAEVQQNFDAGVGQKFALLFKVGHLDNDPITNQSADGMHEDTYVMLTAEDFDDYSYKVYEPRLVVLNAETGLSDSGSIAIEKMEIGINGKVPEAGQAYTRVKTNVGWNLQVRPNAIPANSKRSIASILSTTQYNFITGTAGSGTTFTTKATGTIIPKNVNVGTDQFFLKFAKLGSATDVTVPGAVVLYDPSYNLVASSIDTNNALRNFDAIYASMVQLTGANVNVASKADPSKTIAQLYFDDLRATLPTIADTATYVAPNQVSVTRLAYEFCDQLTRSGSLLGVSINTSVNATTANNVAKALADKFLGATDPLTTTIPGNSSDQTTVVDALVNHPNNTSIDIDNRDLLTKFQDAAICGQATCDTSAARMIKIANAMCIASLASATVALH